MALLTDLARARAAFQLRTILTVMGAPDQERVKNNEGDTIMNDDKKFTGGHFTHNDGSRSAMSEEQANAILDAIEESDRKRAKDMPTVVDALNAISSARQRLRDLGWQKGGGLRLRKQGEPDNRNDLNWVVIEEGSTGVFYANRCDKYFHYQDCVSSHQKVYAKLTSELTPDEKTRADECEASHIERMNAFHNRMAAQSRSQDAEDQERVKK